jgi:alpha-D-ribose 1-methylphosphonate 5-triphosphate synthase subunit PhnH
MTAIAELPTGFADKVLAAQSTFRFLMEATARPGSVQRITASAGKPSPMMHGTAAIALTLFDHDTSIWLDHRMAGAPAIAKWLRFHTAAPIVAASAVCQFALIGDGIALPDLDRFCLGSSEYPDRSTTLILQVASLTEGASYLLQGPGIDGTTVLRATIAPLDLFERLAVNGALFPRGVDVVLVHDDAIVAIPRTTRLIGKEG